MQLSASVPLTAPPSEKRLAAVLQHRYFLRVHMTAILTATVLVGIGVTKLLFALRINTFALRYGVAVLVAYAAFVAFVKLWLAYISARSGGANSLDAIDFSSSGSSSGSSSSSSTSSFSGGGGKFGGAGASGRWVEGDAAPKAAMIPAPVKSSGGGGGGSLDDLGELALVVLIIALVLAIIASFAWLVWAAPGILSETAFNAALAGALTRHAHKATHGNWMGSVMKKTALQFAIVLALAIAVGVVAQKHCPQAHRLAEAVSCVK